jgi:hypothetical protein
MMNESMELATAGLLEKVEVETILNFLKENQRRQIKQEEKRERLKLSQRKFRANCRTKAQYLLEKAWDLFPKKGLDRLKANCLCDTNVNYGGHQLSLGFDLTDITPLTDQLVGTRSLGLRYENEHTVHLRGREMCPYSAQNIDFLKSVHSSIHYRYPKLRTTTKEYMRVNLVAGAKTSPHTDTMRGATPNFFAVEKGEEDGTTPFCLQVRKFPNFKTSVVLLDGNMFIPHKQKRSHLILIGLKEDKPHYYVYPTETIEKLEAYGDIKSYIVVGIKEEKLQVMPDEYAVYNSTQSMPLISINDIFQIAKENPATKPKRLFSYLSEPGRWHCFYGWKHSHNILNGCDYRKRRIHVFYRPVREETSSARLRTKRATNCPINYTYVGCGQDNH